MSILTLFGIARELSMVGKTKASVHIAARLPLAWVKEQRERFRRHLTQNSTVEFYLDNKHYNIRIVGCSVYVTVGLDGEMLFKFRNEIEVTVK